MEDGAGVVMMAEWRGLGAGNPQECEQDGCSRSMSGACCVLGYQVITKVAAIAAMMKEL